MSVELRQLRCLVAIAEAGSFTDAAIDLGISQAAASRTLASLESALPPVEEASSWRRGVCGAAA